MRGMTTPTATSTSKLMRLCMRTLLLLLQRTPLHLFYPVWTG